MEQVLLICDSDKASEFCRDILKKQGFPDVFVCKNGPDAKRRLLEHDYELTIVNAPLRMESAESVAIDIAERNVSQVILLVKNEHFDEVHAHTRDYGVITVTKPIHARELSMAIDFSHIAQSRIKMMVQENKKLQKKMNELKFINHAKILLVQYEELTEEEAHKKIERCAMDERKSRLVISKEIIDRYE